MAGGRRIPVTVDADTQGDFDKAADGLDGVAKKADDADKSLAKLSKGHRVLDAEIGKVAHSIKDLRSEFERTGDLDLLKDARKLEGTRKGLERMKADFIQAGAESGKGFVSALFTDASGAIGGAVSKITANPELLAIGGAIAVPVAAGLATALSGAALAGTAAVGIAGGIVLAAQSDQVRGAWGAVASGAFDQLQDAAIPFEEPLVRAAHRFGAELDDAMPAIRRDFQILAPLVDDLADGAADFVGNLQPGLSDAFEGAVPVIKELSRALPDLGDDVSFFFSELGGAGEAGADALGLTVDILGASVRGLGIVLHEGATAFEVFGGGALAAAARAGVLDDAVGILTSAPVWALFDKLLGNGKTGSDEFGVSVEDLKRRLDTAGQQQAFEQGMQVAEQAMRDGAQAADDMEHRLSDLARQMLSGKDADLAFKSGRLDMIETLKESKGKIDDNTEAGIRAQQSMVGQAQKALAVRDSVLAQTHSVEAADKAYDDHITQLYRDAAANGYTKEKVDGVIGSLNTIPKPNPVDIALKRSGYTDDDLREMKRSLLGAQGTYTATVNVVRNTYFNEVTRSYSERLPGPFAGGLAKGGLRKAQVGMFIPPSDPGTVLTGEPQTGGEWLIPARGISTARAAMLGERAMSGYGLDVVPRAPGYAAVSSARPMRSGGGNPTVINLNITAGMGVDGYRLGQQIVETALRPFIQRNGNNVQLAIVGRQVP